MNNFDKFNKIRNSATRKSDVITNMAEVSGDVGFKCVRILWLYPDTMNIHGGRGDVMALLHIADLLGIPVEIRRCDRLSYGMDWKNTDIAYMTAGELKCVPEVSRDMEHYEKGMKEFINDGGVLIANGSSGAVLGNTLTNYGGRTTRGLGLLDMDWKERESVWGDDIWIKTEEGMEIIGNQIQVADITLGEGQKPFGEVIYGRGNNGDGVEGAVKGNVIYTGVLGPVLTKNPEFTAWILKQGAAKAGIETVGELDKNDIEIELKSAEYIKAFMKEKMAKK